MKKSRGNNGCKGGRRSLCGIRCGVAING